MSKQQENGRSVKQRLSTSEAAAYVGLSHHTLRKYRQRCQSPSFIKVGAKILYDVKDLDAFLNSHRHQMG